MDDAIRKNMVHNSSQIRECGGLPLRKRGQRLSRYIRKIARYRLKPVTFQLNHPILGYLAPDTLPVEGVTWRQASFPKNHLVGWMFIDLYRTYMNQLASKSPPRTRTLHAVRFSGESCITDIAQRTSTRRYPMACRVP